VPGPGYQDGQSKGKNHLSADGVAEHVVFLLMPKRMVVLKG
jgi:hypothetical protein